MRLWWLYVREGWRRLRYRHRLVGAVVLLVIAFSLSGRDESGRADHSTDALLTCKRAVGQHLRNPATADFELGSMSLTETGAGYRVTGKVKGQSDFGVPTEFHFSCEADTAGDVTSSSVVPAS